MLLVGSLQPRSLLESELLECFHFGFHYTCDASEYYTTHYKTQCVCRLPRLLLYYYFLTGWAFKLLHKSYLNDLRWHLTVIFLENSRSKNHVILKPIPKAELYAVCRDKGNYPIAALWLMNTLFLLPVKNRDEILHLNWNNMCTYICIFLKAKL